MYALANVLKEGPNVSRVKKTDWGIPIAAVSGILLIVVVALAVAGIISIHRHNQQQNSKGKICPESPREAISRQ